MIVTKNHLSLMFVFLVSVIVALKLLQCVIDVLGEVTLVLKPQSFRILSHVDDGLHVCNCLQLLKFVPQFICILFFVVDYLR